MASLYIPRSYFSPRLLHSIRLPSAPQFPSMSTTNRIHRESRLPAGISAQAVIDLLHDHTTVVRLNPLVRSVQDIEAPKTAAEEYRALRWKRVVDEIAYLPAGIWKGSVSYEVCFEDLLQGVKATAWAPMGLFTSSRWMVTDRKDGEGLVVSEDCETKCSFILMPFVKKTQNEAHETMVIADDLNAIHVVLIFFQISTIVKNLER